MRNRDRVLLATFTLAFLIGWIPLPEALLRALEERFEPPRRGIEVYAGIVVLGGAIDAPQSHRTKGAGPVSSVNERLTVPATLMQQYPHLRLLYLGCEETVGQPDGSKMNKAQFVFTRLGVDQRRVIYEEASLNTYENALLGSQVPGVNKRDRWLLVTSARHMPRSLSTFKTAGWNVTPYPVDYLSSNSAIEWMEYSLTSGVRHWELALREYAGGLIYFLSGRANPLR